MLAVVLAAGALPFVPEQAAAAPVDLTAPIGRSVAVSAMRTQSAASTAMEGWQPTAVTWPQAATVEVELPDDDPDALVRAGTLPVSVGRAIDETTVQGRGTTDELDRARVRVFSQDVAAAAGVRGVLLQVERADGITGAAELSVEVDVSGFASAFGAGWASRLRLVELPGCVVQTPASAGCAVVPTVAASSRFDARTMRVSGRVHVAPPTVSSSDPQVRKLARLDGLTAGEGTVMAVMAGPSSDEGDLTKTPFSASYKWQSGKSGGDFSWSYGFQIPPVPGGLVPQLGLSYSSGSVDGQTAAENVQPGVVGEGWDFSVGHIERSYRSCSDDTANSPHYSNATGDQCWRLSNARMVWNGKSTELIPTSEDGYGVWRAVDDDGMKIEKITSDWSTADIMFSPGDFNGDGDTDALYRRRSDGKLFMAPGDGAGGFRMDHGSIRLGSFGTAGHIFSPGDFDGDGKADVLWRKASDGTMWRISGNGTGGWISGNSTQIGSFGTADLVFSPGDFDGDAKPDVIWRKGSDGTLWRISGNGTGGWLTGNSIQTGSGWGAYDLIMSPGDFNGDGKADVIARHATSKNLFLFTGNGAGGWLTGVGQQIATGPASADILFSGGRHDDDTANDVLWRSASTKDVFLLAGNGAGAWKTGGSVNTTAAVRTGTGDDEYWKVTTVDGTQYFFGRSKLPNWQPLDREMNSQWTAPVFANHAGEPCFNTAGFTSSWCQMAYRWNLDYVVDRHGNSMAYFYDTETTHTGLAGNASTIAAYDHGGWLTRVEYGMRAGQERTTTNPPAKVVFGMAERCMSSCWSGTAWSSNPNTANWPDTPWDIDCKAAPCTGNLSPTFWTSRRMATVTTYVKTSTSGYDDVDRWDLGPWFPATGNTTDPVLWLLTLKRTGLAGTGSVALPEIGFSGERMDQRADYDPNGGMSQPRKWRMEWIDTETGGRIEVKYSGTDPGCQFGGTWPDPDHNTKRCFAQWYKPKDAEDDGFSWWHKYVVTSVSEIDQVGGSPTVVHNYTYSTAGASNPVLWAHDDGGSTWSTPLARRSWGDWRGYPTVTVKSGPTGNQSQSTYLYFRGLQNDYVSATGETRSSKITNSVTSSEWTDFEHRAGHLFEKIDYSAPGGQILRKTIYEPTDYAGFTRTLSDVWAIPTTFTSRINRTRKERVFTWIATPAPGAWRETQKTSTFDPTYGLVTEVHDAGDTDPDAEDDTCTRTAYAHNTTDYLIDFRTSVETASADCATALTSENAVAQTRYRYDDAPFGEPPTRGNVTTTEQVKKYTGTAPEWIMTSAAGYDTFGRVSSVEDALNRPTTTEYDEPNGVTTEVRVIAPQTGAYSHMTTTTLDPTRGQPTEIEDENLKVTTGDYDALGRLLKVTRPGNTTNTPDTAYDYSITKDGPSWIRTRELGPNGNQINSYEIFDGLLRPRQTQETAPDGKRVIIDTAYDGRGLAVKTSTYYNNASGPASTLVTAADAAIDRQMRYTFDGLGRQKTAETWSQNLLKWKTATAYDGYNTTITPPAGGTVTTNINDARGRLAELRQHGPNGDNSTFYTYDKASRLETVKDAKTNVWEYYYDLLGRQTTIKDPDAGTTEKTYDNAGQLLTTTDERQVTLAYTYDALGRKTAVYEGSTSGTPRAEWVYDTVAKGQLTSATRNEGGRAYTNTINAYSDDYQPLSTTVTIPAPTINGNLADTYTTETTYKINGSPATVTLPAAGGLPAETITTTYNAQGLPISVTGSEHYLTDIAYRWDSTIGQTLHGNPTLQRRLRQTHAYEEATGRLSSSQLDTESLTTPGTFQDRFTTSYAYDNAGTVKAIAGKTDGAGDQAECFNYDHLRRLTDAWTTTWTSSTTWNCDTTPVLGGAGDDPYWRKWTFDSVGNRETETHKAATETVWTYHVPADGQPQQHTLTSLDATGPLALTPTRTFEYDAAGNTIERQTDTGTTQTLTWDPESHLATLTEAGNTTSYVYDAEGNRLIGRAPGKTTLYLGHTELQMNASGQVTGTRYYTVGTTAVAVRVPDSLYWTATDHHGTQQIQINTVDLTATRNRSMPYGGPRGPQTQFAGTKGFVGGTQDSTGLTHLGAREYDPTIGRFISPDPLMDLTDPQQWNPYAYSNNNPATFTDPDGLIARTYDSGGAGTGGGRSYGGSASGWFGTTYRLTPISRTGTLPTVRTPSRTGDREARGTSQRQLKDLKQKHKKKNDDDDDSCKSHSFSPDTRVLMADGSGKAIKDVVVGDKVAASDAASGATTERPVTQLHINIDTKLANVTVRESATGNESIIRTTPNHPFWDVDEQDWIAAGELAVGHQLFVHDDRRLEGDGTGAGVGGGGPGRSIEVVRVDLFSAHAEMRDLTVAEMHTYYVFADETPVLVHNCTPSVSSADINNLLIRSFEISDAYGRDNATVAVARVYNNETEEYEEWVATHLEDLPVEVRNVLDGAEYKFGKGDAEATIIAHIKNGQGTGSKPKYELLGIASSNRMCKSCFGAVTSIPGMRPSNIGRGDGKSVNTIWRTAYNARFWDGT